MYPLFSTSKDLDASRDRPTVLTRRYTCYRTHFIGGIVSEPAEPPQARITSETSKRSKIISVSSHDQLSSYWRLECWILIKQKRNIPYLFGQFLVRYFSFIRQLRICEHVIGSVRRRRLRKSGCSAVAAALPQGRPVQAFTVTSGRRHSSDNTPAFPSLALTFQTKSQIYYK